MSTSFQSYTLVVDDGTDTSIRAPIYGSMLGLEDGVLGSGTPFIYSLDPVGPWEHLSLLADCRGHLWEMPP
jgi:hypothetical protein